MKIPTTDVYEDVMDILNGKNAVTPEEKQRASDYKHEVLGTTSLRSAPDEYWQIGTILELGISPAEWRSWSINDRAKVLARQYIKNMVEVIDSYYKDQDRRKEKNKKKDGKD